MRATSCNVLTFSRAWGRESTLGANDWPKCNPPTPVHDLLATQLQSPRLTADIIECMAQSDNVVRAGLTPKLRDVDTLIEMLTYESGPGSKQLLKPEIISPSTSLYDPPIDEFSVFKVSLDKGKEVHRPIDGPSLSVVTTGKGSVQGKDGKIEIEKGDVLFIGAGEEVSWESEQELVVFRAYVEAK